MVLDQKLHRGPADILHAGAILDVAGGVHAGLPAQVDDVAHPAALVLHSALRLCRGVLVGCGPVLAAGAVIGVDHGLAAVELGLLVRGQAAALAAGKVDQLLLTGKCFLSSVHVYLQRVCSG